MRVNIIGFELDFARNIKLPEVYQLLESNQGKKHAYYGDKYLYYTDVVDDYIVGIILRLKKDKGRITTKEDGKEFIVDIDKLAKGQSSTEVSLFCMNPKTKMGVFYSYFGGLSPSILRTMWKPAHNKVQRAKIRDLCKQYEGSNKYEPSKARAKAEENFKGVMLLRTLTTPATIENLFKVFNSIQEITINSKSAVQGAGKYSPNSSFIKKASVNIKFNSAVAWYQHIQGYIRKALPTNITDDDKIRIVGETIGGEEKAYVIGENLQEFGAFEFDDFITKIPQKKWSDYSKCDAIKVLLLILKNKTIIFGHTVPEKSWRLLSAQSSKKDGN